MKIICIGRNYINHAKELGNAIPSEPLFFLKPNSAIQPKGHPFFIPFFSNDIHYEVELVIKISKAGKHIEERFAHNYYSQIGLGIDFTARDIQQECKEKGLPWEKAKAFDGSAVVGQFYPKEQFDLGNLKFQLYKNNEIVQDGNTNAMLWKTDELISYVSQYFTLKKGDIIFTGTPAGVGKVLENDILKGVLEGEEAFNIRVK